MIEIAYLRNQLANRQFGDEEKEILQKIIEEINKNPKSPFYTIAISSIKHCQINLKNGDLEAAMQEMDFIHNFPLVFEDISEWDEDYFYKGELLGFLDYLSEFSKTERIKVLIKDLSILQDRLANKSVVK